MVMTVRKDRPRCGLSGRQREHTDDAKEEWGGK